MKKQVIAIMVSMIMTVGSVGGVSAPAWAAETTDEEVSVPEVDLSSEGFAENDAEQEIFDGDDIGEAVSEPVSERDDDEVADEETVGQISDDEDTENEKGADAPEDSSEEAPNQGDSVETANEEEHAVGGDVIVEEADRQEERNDVAMAFAGGSGTENDPYQVKTAAQLDAIRNDLNAYYIQAADIDLSGIDWNPIANEKLDEWMASDFKGEFDGNGYTIENLTINTLKTNNVYGLFGFVNGVIKNVNLKNCIIDLDLEHATDNLNNQAVAIGTIAAEGENIINCKSSGTISLSNCLNASVGGIVGNGNASYSTNYTDISIKAFKNALGSETVSCGGITGEPCGSINSVIRNCINYGEIFAESNNFLYLGGISGEYGIIINCVNAGNIVGNSFSDNSYNSSSGICQVGGIVGYTESKELRDCVNFGDISGKSVASCYVGGIAGFSRPMFSETRITKNCYNIGKSISSEVSKSDDYAARVIGCLFGSASELYSVNTTLVNGTIPTEDIGANYENGANMSDEDIKIEVSDILEECGCEWPDTGQENEYIDPDDEEVTDEVYQAFEEHAESRPGRAATFKWSFPNWKAYFPDSSYGYYISRRDFKRLIRGLPFTERVKMVGELKTNGNSLSYWDNNCWTERLNVDRLGTPYTYDANHQVQSGDTIDWRGSCAGMSTLAMLINNGVIDADDIESGATSVASIKPSSSIASAINFYQVQQSSSYQTKKNDEFYQLGVSGGQSAQLAQCEQMAQRAMNNGTVFEIFLNWYSKEGGKWEPHGHIVLGYGLDKSIGNIVFNGVTYTKRILIYDNANPYKDLNTTDLYFNDHGGFCVPGYGIYSTSIDRNMINTDNGRIVLATDEAEVLNTIDYVTGKHQVNSFENECQYIITPILDFFRYIIKDEETEEVWEIIPEKSTSNNSDKKLTVIANSNVHKNGTTANEYTIVLPDSTHNYTIMTEETGINCTVCRGGHLVSVKASSPGQVTLEDSGEVYISTENKDEISVTMVADSPYESTEMNLISISSSELSEFSSKVDNNGVYISTDSSSEITVFGCNEEDIFTDTIETAQGDFTIIEDEIIPDTGQGEYSITNSMVSGITNKVCTGKEIKQKVTLRARGSILTENTDYYISYENNINPGTATITITGIGNYTGTITKTFLILPGKTTRGDMFNLANNVKVTWKEVPGAKYYKVYREGITDKKETQKEPVIVTERLIGWDSKPGLTNGHAYRYKIVASLTGKGDPSGDSTLSYSKLMYRLKTVVIRSVKNTAPGKVTVKYDKTVSGDSYVLQYCERQDMVGAKTKVVLGANNTSYVIGGLKKGKTYYISIRVRKKVNGIDYYTTFGVPKKVTVTK